MRTDRNPGDVSIGRVNGTADIYVVGIIAEGPYGLTLADGHRIIKGRDAALRLGYASKTDSNIVWIVDGQEPTDTAYDVAPRPSN
jgi:hypothetical protein